MAYSTHSNPALAGSSIAGAVALLVDGITGFFGSLSRAATVNSTAHERLAQAERLNAKSDEELAAMGLKREDIARHVFRDLFWT